MEQPSVRDIAAILRNELVGDSGEPLTVRGPIYTLEYSDIYRAECGRFEFPLAVKVCKDPATGQTDRATAKSQFLALNRVGSKMTSADYGVPRTVSLIEDQAIIITEWVCGDSLTRVLYRQRSSGATVLDLLRRAGIWLRLFHSSNPLRPGRLDVSEKIASIREAHKRGDVRCRMLSEAIAVLEASAERAGAGELRRSWIHGDYKTDNLLVAGRRLVGLDVHIIHESAVHYDVAAFLNRLQLTLLHARAWRLLPHYPSFERAFVQESLQEEGLRTALPLAWIRLYMILCSWIGQRTRRTGWAQRRYLELCFRRLTQRLTRDLVRLRSA